MATTQHLEYKSGNGGGIVKILANKGITWQVQDETTGDIFLVQKKHVVRGPWEETPDEELPPPAPGSLAAQMAEAAKAATAKPADKRKGKSDPKPAPDRTGIVTLKELCFNLGIEPRIARRRLRKALGQVGTGQRWEWQKDSAEYNKVIAALVPPKAAEPEQEAPAEPQTEAEKEALVKEQEGTAE